MIYTAHIREDFVDGHKTDGMGFVIGSENSYMVTTVQFIEYNWVVETLQDGNLIGKEESTYVYGISNPPRVVRITYGGIVREFDDDDRSHRKKVCSCDGPNRMFDPVIKRLGWVMTKNGMMENPWKDAVEGRGERTMSLNEKLELFEKMKKMYQEKSE